MLLSALSVKSGPSVFSNIFNYAHEARRKTLDEVGYNPQEPPIRLLKNLHLGAHLTASE
jgi:hypothetical protein